MIINRKYQFSVITPQNNLFGNEKFLKINTEWLNTYLMHHVKKCDLFTANDGGRIANSRVVNTSVFIQTPITSPRSLDAGSAPCVTRAVVVVESPADKILVRLGGPHGQIDLDVILVLRNERAIVHRWRFALETVRL